MNKWLRRALADVLRRRRTSAGLTQEKVAELMGISRNFYGNLERAEFGASLELTDLAAHALGMRLSDLVNEVEQEQERLKQERSKRRS